MKRKTILGSILTIIMCLSLAVGATFALFTSESEVNIAVTSGRVDVQATTSELDTDIFSGTATKVGNEIAVERMVPGDSFSFDIVIESYSNVIVQYRTIISNTDGGLFTALKITLTENEETTVYHGGYVYQSWAELIPSDSDATTVQHVKTINVKVEFPNSDAPQNQYQNASCTMNVRVEAVQGNATVENPIDYDATNDVYVVNNEEGMMLMNGIINSSDDTVNFALNDDMDMDGYNWMALEMKGVNVDGQGHTISNLNCVSNPTLSENRASQVGFAAYFENSSLSNVNFVDVVAVGEQAGIIAGCYESGVVSNVTIDGECLVEWRDNEEVNCGGIGVVFGVMNVDIASTNYTSAIIVSPTATVTLNYNNIATTLALSGNEFCFNNNTVDAMVSGGAVSVVGSLDPSVDGVLETSDGTIYITNLNNLLTFASAVNNNTANENNYHKNVALIVDLDLTDVDWTPIGNGAHRFAGTFDGRNHTITGLNFDTPSANGVAFFGGIVNATIKNINFDNANLAPANGYYVGVVTAYAFANNTFENVHVSNAYVSGVAMVGAMIACDNEMRSNNTFINCSVTDSKIVVAYDGGAFVGYSNLGSTVAFTDCAVTNVDFQLTGIAGGTYEYIDGRMYYMYTGYGRFAAAGKLYSYASMDGGTVQDKQEGVTITNTGYVGGVLWNGDDTFYIDDAEGLCYVANQVNYGEFYNIFTYRNVVLIDDIDLTGIDWEPIGSGYDTMYLFSTFDGLGHTIYGLNQTKAWGSYGLFGSVWEVTIKNVTIDRCKVAPDMGKNVGIVAGYAFGNVVLENINVTNFYVSGFGNVGGLIGFISANPEYSITITNCTLDDGMIINTYNGGGLIGYVGKDVVHTFTNCVINDVAYQLTGTSDYSFDSEGRLFWYGYCAVGPVFCVEDQNWTGWPVTEYEGVTITKSYYDIVSWYPDGRVDIG